MASNNTKEILDEYLDHQDKLIKIFNQKQKVLNKIEQEQTKSLKEISKRSEALGDAGFASFANVLISKEHDHKDKQDKLEDIVNPR